MVVEMSIDPKKYSGFSFDEFNQLMFWVLSRIERSYENWEFTIIRKTIDSLCNLFKGLQGVPFQSYENCKNYEIYENCEIYDNLQDYWQNQRNVFKELQGRPIESYENYKIYQNLRNACFECSIPGEQEIYVICRLGVGPYSEKLWPRSWKCCQRPQSEGSIFKPEVTVFHYTDRP